MVIYASAAVEVDLAPKALVVVVVVPLIVVLVYLMDMLTDAAMAITQISADATNMTLVARPIADLLARLFSYIQLRKQYAAYR